MHIHGDQHDPPPRVKQQTYLLSWSLVKEKRAVLKQNKQGSLPSTWPEFKLGTLPAALSAEQGKRAGAFRLTGKCYLQSVCWLFFVVPERHIPLILYPGTDKRRAFLSKRVLES